MSGFLGIISNLGGKKFLGLALVMYLLNTVEGGSADVKLLSMAGAAGLFFLGQGIADFKKAAGGS